VIKENMPSTFIKVYNMIISNLEKIEKLIHDIPNEYNGIPVISDNRKVYYLKTLKIRLDYIAKEFL
jgi:hypothetical protein